jgi:general secretion pathway protein C
MTDFWFWPVVAVIAISLGVAAAPVAWHVLGEVEGNALQTSAQAAAPVATFATPADVAAVLAAVPFGQVAAIAAPAAPMVPTADLGLTLLGLTIATDHAASRAIIAGGDTPVGSYAIGTAIIAGVVLEQVHPDHVILAVNGATAALYFATDAADAALNAAPLVPMVAGGPPDPTNPDAVIAYYRDEILQNPQAVLDRLGLQATPQGYLITDAADPDVRRAGFQPGDLVTRVNGLGVGDVAQDQVSFDAIAASGQATVEIARAGQTITMTFPLR